MAIYWIACYFSVFIAFICEKMKMLKKENSRLAAVLISFPLFLLSAFRYDVGTDYLSYYVLYQNIAAGDTKGVEPLFVALNKIVAFTVDEFQWVIAICSAVFIYFIVLEIIRSSSIVPLSVFLIMGSLHYFYSLTNIRQMVGCAILLYSMRYVETEEFKKFFLCVLTASLFHVSCWFFLIVYLFLRKIKIPPLWGITISTAIVASRGLISVVARWLISHTKYVYYLGSARWDVDEVSYATMAVQGAVLIIAVLYNTSQNRFYNILLNVQYVSFWISLCSGVFPQVYRIQRMFGIVSIILLPNAIARIKSWRVRLIVILIIVILYSIYAYVSAGIHDQYKIIPYQSIFDA